MYGSRQGMCIKAFHQSLTLYPTRLLGLGSPSWWEQPELVYIMFPSPPARSQYSVLIRSGFGFDLALP